MRQFAALALICLLIGCAGCRNKTNKDFTGNDRLMVDAAQQIRDAINAYDAEAAEFPQDIRAVEQYFPPGTKWPDNPYTHTPITDSGSDEFDPAKSAGTVHYEKYMRDGQIAGYRLHVFGAKGRLMIFDNSAFGAQ